MPEIKLKHVVSFSSEDKVHKAENLLKAETYRKWKCASPGEKNASVILQFEKAININSIDIGNESSAFVKVLVGRSSQSVNDYQVLLVASSFMSPIESRNETHTNRVRMFGPDKLAQNLKEEKWDCVQIVCTQPFNKNITYGLSFIKFHSPPEKTEDIQVNPATVKLGAFKLKCDEDDEDSLPSIGSWLERKKSFLNSSLVDNSKSPTSIASSASPKATPAKRKHENSDNDFNRFSAKTESPAVKNKVKMNYKDIIGTNIKNNNQTKSKESKITDVKALSPEASSASNKQTSKLQATNLQQSGTAGKVDSKTAFRDLMKGVVFVISGFVNPLRSEIRDKGLEMGAKYKGDWDKTCTHLICAFVNTPKYLQVKGENGKIVTKDWIIDCHKKRTLLPWRKYMLGRYARESSSEDSSEEEQPAVKRNKLGNGDRKDVSKIFTMKSDDTSKMKDKNKKSEYLKEIEQKNSETEDEEAIQDYYADTDVDSGGNTEDEIRKVQNHKSNDEIIDSDDDSSLLQTKPDTSALPLPELPNLFKLKHFLLYGDFSISVQNALKRLIISYNGVVKDYMCDTVKYVISESKWDKNFDDALAENEDLIFVRPDWIWKCHEKEKLIPYQPYIITPDP